MKRFCLFVSALLSILVLKAEPYRPYPVIMVHGYNADNYNGSNFGITILSSTEEENVSNPTTPSPVPTTIDGESGNYYISRNEGERIEYNKLAYKMAELNRTVIDSWANATQGDGADTLYWLNNDIGIYREIPTTGDLLDGYINDQGVRVYSRPINCFLETMEFDYPEIGSSNSTDEDLIDPTNYQIGRGRELLMKLKETLINYYTSGRAKYVKRSVKPGLKMYYDVEILDETGTQRALKESDLRGDSKVIFVAHSYGGVNLRQMLLEINKNTDDQFLFQHIDRIVTVNTPHLGAPETNHGNEMTNLWEDSSWWWFYCGKRTKMVENWRKMIYN